MTDARQAAEELVTAQYSNRWRPDKLTDAIEAALRRFAADVLDEVCDKAGAEQPHSRFSLSSVELRAKAKELRDEPSQRPEVKEEMAKAMALLPVQCWQEECGEWAVQGSDYCEEHDLAEPTDADIANGYPLIVCPRCGKGGIEQPHLNDCWRLHLAEARKAAWFEAEAVCRNYASSMASPATTMRKELGARVTAAEILAKRMRSMATCSTSSILRGGEHIPKEET